MIDSSPLLKGFPSFGDITKQYGGYTYIGAIGGVFGDYLGLYDLNTIPIPGIVPIILFYILANSVLLCKYASRFERSQVAAEKTCHFCGGAMKIDKYVCVECGRESG